MKASPQLFRQAMGYFATGVTLVTTWTPEQTPYGVTVNSFTSVSLDPLLVLVCLDNELSALSSFKRVGKFGVSILSEHQKDLSIHFSTRGTDRSRGLYEIGPLGMPLAKDALATLECRLERLYPAGDHTILLGRVETVCLNKNARNPRPLLFFRGRYGRVEG